MSPAHITEGKVAILTPTDPSITCKALAEAGFSPLVVRTDDELRAALADAVGLVIGAGFYKTHFSAISNAGPGLRFIQLSAAGFEVVEELGAPQGVQVARAEGIWGGAVAGHALMLVLSLLRKIPDSTRQQVARHWCRTEISPQLASLADRRVLVLGYGDIGSTLCGHLEHLGAEVTVIAASARSGGPSGGIRSLRDLDALLPQAEVLVCALPANDETRDLLNRERLLRLPKDAIVVNVGRGEVLDEAALAECLNSGALAGAALDVFREEPLPGVSPLWSTPNLLITPHVSPLGDRRALRMLAERVVENALRAMRGEDMQGRIDIRR